MTSFTNTAITILTLVTGPSALTRERAIWSVIEADMASNGYLNRNTAVIFEGLPDGKSGTEPLYSNLQINRISHGCFCCIGNLTLRVTLNRLLRTRPTQMYISIANATHVDKIHDFLSLPPYDAWLKLGDAITA